jgi:SAM-dependent methyltransferase
VSLEDTHTTTDRKSEVMEGSYPGKLRIWTDWDSPAHHEVRASIHGFTLTGPHQPAEFAERLYACEALNPGSPPPRSEAGAEPYSLQWFLNIENQRHTRHGRWIPRLLEFAKHSGETLLGLGNGLGTDWLQYARYGASVIVCSPSAEQLALVRRNFELRSIAGRFVHAKAASLPLENASIDVACISDFFHEIKDPKPVVDEIFRVLKPGGKILAVTPSRYDVDFWFHRCFPWQRWLSAKPEKSAPEATRFTARELRRIFNRFVEHRIHKRQLRRREVPHVWRWVPLPILERLMGRFLVLKAFKPLSVALATPLAA